MFPDRENALVWMAFMSLCINLLVLAFMVLFLYFAIDYTAHTIDDVKDHALRAMGTGYIPRDPEFVPSEHEPNDPGVDAPKKRPSAKKNRKPRGAGAEVTVTEPKCCV